MVETRINTDQIEALAEYVRDVMGAALVAGSNVTVTVDDGADTITLASTGGGGGGGGTLVDPGDLLTVTSSSPVSISNLTPTGNQEVSAAPSTVERVVADMDLTLDPYGASVSALIDFWWSMSQSGTLKTVTVRLRRDSLTGTVLAQNEQSATVDSTGGHDRQWSTTFVDNAPTTGHYVITVQATGPSSVAIYSDTRTFTLSSTVAAQFALPIGTTGQVLTADLALSPKMKWAAPTGGGGGGAILDSNGAEYALDATIRGLLRATRVGTTDEAGYTAAVLTQAPWAAWKFAETSGTTAADETANGRALVHTGGGVLVDQAAWSGKGVRYPGGASSGAYSIHSGTAFDNVGSYSMTCVVRAQAGRSDPIVLGGAYDAAGNSYTQITLSPNGSVTVDAYTGSSVNATSAAGVVPDDTWVHIATVHNGSTHKAYVNGVEVCSVNLGNVSSSSAKRWRTRWQPGGATNSALDMADQAVWLGAAISTANITAQYAAFYSDTTARTFRPIAGPVVKTAAYTAKAWDLVLADATSAAFTVTLPTTHVAGDEVAVKKTDASVNVVTIAGAGGALVDGNASHALSVEDAVAVLVSDGTNWHVQAAGYESTGGGGGGGGVTNGRRYWARNTTQETSGVVPTTDTLVAGLTIAIPSAEVTRVAFLGLNAVFTGSHTNRFSLYLDGVKVWPMGANANASNHGANTTYEIDVSEIPVVLAAGAGHTVEVRWNASDSTAAVTWNDRYVFADVYDGAGTSPLAIGGGPQGDPGPLPFTTPVAWAMSTAYTVGPPASAVVYDGETFVAIVSHTSTSEFDPTKWVKIAAKGLSGNDTGADHIVGVGVSKITVATTLPPVGPAGDMVILR